MPNATYLVLPVGRIEIEEANSYMGRKRIDDAALFNTNAENLKGVYILTAK